MRLNNMRIKTTSYLKGSAIETEFNLEDSEEARKIADKMHIIARNQMKGFIDFFQAKLKSLNCPPILHELEKDMYDFMGSFPHVIEIEHNPKNTEELK